MTEKQIAHALSLNPHSLWRSPLLWFRWRRVQILYSDYSSMRVVLNDFERDLLLPTLRERLEYMKELCRRVQGISADPEVRKYLGPAIEKVVGKTEKDIVSDYLGGISQQVEENFFAGRQSG